MSRCFISKKKLRVTLWTVLPILIFSITMLLAFPVIFESILKRNLTLQNGTVAFQFWNDIPMPIYERLYFFNITNKHEFLSGREQLNLSEIGPYTYKLNFVKTNFTWNSNNTLSYRERKMIHFLPHLSNGNEDDVIYTLNGPLLISSRLAKGFAMKALLSTLVSAAGEDIVIERSIKQLAYGGYKDSIIKVAPILIPDIPYKDGIFCWLYGLNATDEEAFTVFTGADDPAKTDLINLWNGHPKLTFWKGDTCNMVNGTNIVHGPPVRYYGNSYTFYQSIFCRSLTYSYAEDKEHFGIQVKRFVLTYDLFANSTENPDNYCFEVNGERPSGIVDISSCKFGAPVFISSPHFYMADPNYLININGLRPNQAEHGSHIDIEIETGFSVYVKVRFQFNVEISKAGGILEAYGVADGLYPLFWAEISLEIDKTFANYIHRKIKNPKNITYLVLVILTSISSILVIFCCVILCMKRFEDSSQKHLLGIADK